MSILDLIIALPVVALLIFSRPASDNSVFGRDSTATLRGIAMIWIIVHHIQGRSAFGGSPLLTPIGYLATGLFFFISGYGNTLSLCKHLGTSDSIRFNWLLKKIKKIYIPFFVVYLLCYLDILLLRPASLPSLKNTVVELLTVSLPNETIWFTKVILLCFILHWIFGKIFAKTAPEANAVAISIALLIYVFCMIILKFDSFWYNSVLCYPFGIIVAVKKDGVLTAVNTKGKKYLFSAGSFIAFLIAFLGTKYVGYLQIICALLFSVMCFSYTALFNSKTRFLAFIGNNSFEFFLVHIACLGVFRNLINNNKYWYVAAVFTVSVVVVYIYKTVEKILTSGVKKRCQKKSTQ